MAQLSKLKYLPWLEIIIVLAMVGINAFAAFSDAYNLPNYWFTRDDAYYYFKVAQNISEGHGSTFDGINQTNGYHPLWLLVCVPIFSFARLDLILPLRILIIVLALLRAATSILLYRFLKKILAHPIAILAGIYWAFDPYIHMTAYQQGLETGLTAFCLVLLLVVFQKFEPDQETDATSNHIRLKRPQISTLAILSIFVVFSRLDMVFLILIFGLWIVFRGTPLRYLLPLDILALSVSTVAAFIIRTGLPGYYQYSEMALAMLVLGLVLYIPLIFFSGLYQHPRSYSFSQLITKSMIVIGVSTTGILVLLLGLIAAGVLHGNFPRTAPLIHGALSLILIILVRLVVSLFSRNKNPGPSPPLDLLKSRWREWLGKGVVYYGILSFALGLYMLANQILFGTSSPVSGQIKRWWGSFASRVYGGAARTVVSFFGLDAEGDRNAWHPITTLIENWHRQFSQTFSLPLKYDLQYTLMLVIAGLVVTGLLLINRKRTSRLIHRMVIIPLFTGSVLQIIQYNITGYSALKEWYWIGQMIVIILITALLLDILTQKLRANIVLNITLYILVIFWSGNSIYQFAQMTARQMPYTSRPAGTPYMEVAAFVETHTEPGSRVGMTGGGNVGYFLQDRTIVNMDGLINSHSYYQAHRAQQGSQYLYDIGLEYIFANPSFLEIQPYRGQYTDRLEIIEFYGGKAIMHFLPAQ